MEKNISKDIHIPKLNILECDIVPAPGRLPAHPVLTLFCHPLPRSAPQHSTLAAWTPVVARQPRPGSTAPLHPGGVDPRWHPGRIDPQC